MTNFAAVDDGFLLWMLYRGAPESVRDIATAWDAVAVALQERAHDLEVEHRRLRPSWVGEAADQYATSILSLIRATRRVSEMAALVRDVMHDSADALDQARSTFPPPPGFDPARDLPARLADVALGRWQEPGSGTHAGAVPTGSVPAGSVPVRVEEQRVEAHR